MTTRFTRRFVAAAAAASLLLVGAPLASPAQAAVAACAPGATCSGALTGSLGSTAFEIQMPENFNGTVLMYSHGYRVSTPIPAALAVPLGFAADASYQKINFPAFTPVFGTDVAYVGSGRADVSPSPTVTAALLGQGYALAGVGYAQQGWAINEAVEANELLLKHVKAGAVKGVKRVLSWGTSFGGLTAATFAEKHPDQIDGVLPTCAPLAGPEQAMNTAMTVMFSWKTLIAPTLRVANYQSYAQALTDLGTVLQTLVAVGQGKASVSAVGYPIAQANLLAGLMGGLPTVSSTYDGVTQNPAFATLGTAAALAGGYQPASAGASSAAAMLENVGAAAALGVMVRYDLEQKARLSAGIPADQSANFTDNVNVSYSALLSDEQRGEFGDTLNATTVMPNALNAMLASLDASKGNAAVRFAANPAAVKAIRALPAPKGTYTGPTVLLTTDADPIVPAGNSAFYAKALAASAKKQGETALVGSYVAMPPPDGWTVFDPGAKGPNSAASAAGATTGVGHCNFRLDGGVQLVNSVTALNRIVANPTPKGLKSANHLMWATAGMNGDGFYEPAALKRPALAR